MHGSLASIYKKKTQEFSKKKKREQLCGILFELFT